MQKKLAMKWVKALRSGKYNQVPNQLVELNSDYGDCESNEKVEVIGYCCLGILGRVCGYENSDLAPYELPTENMTENFGLKNNEGEPLNEMGDTLTLTLKAKNPVTNRLEEKTFGSLAEANDKGVTFKRIATWIEKNYKLL